MSREVDTSDLSALEDEDLLYLHGRGQITTQQFADARDNTVDELSAALKELTQRGIPLEDQAHTGTANTKNLTKEEFQAQAKPSADDDSEEEEDEALEPPYDAEGITNDDLRAEIMRRNEGREEQDQMSIDGKKAQLIATLEEDDEE